METVASERLRGKHVLRDIRSFLCGEQDMMDTPGFSSMYIEDLEPNELKHYFRIF